MNAIVDSKHISVLKALFLSKLEQEGVSPADCETIALLVELKAGNRINQMTLRRFLGLSFSRFGPSTFTLDSISMFCNYQDWAAFIDKQSNRNSLDKF